MIVLKDNNTGTVYLAESTDFSLYDGYESPASAQLPENLQTWRVPGTDIVACVCGSGFEADIFRFDGDLISGDLTMEKLVLETVPKIKRILSRFGKLDDDNLMNVQFAFAQGDKAFVISGDFCVTEIMQYAAYNDREERGLSALRISADLPAEERLAFAYQFQSGHVCKTLAVIDTKTLTPRVIGGQD